MAQFDVHRNPAGSMADAAPYVVDIQAECVSGLPTRMIVPLVRGEDGLKPVRHLNPIVDVKDERLVVMTHMMAAVPANVLGPAVATLAGRRTDIVAALDFLFTGI
jgi:toxin CcdB